MSTWQTLYDFLAHPDLHPEDVVAAMKVKPSRLRKLLTSKRLAEKMAAIEAISRRRADHTIRIGMDMACKRLTELLGEYDSDQVRKVCMDVLSRARAAERAQERRPVRKPEARRARAIPPGRRNAAAGKDPCLAGKSAGGGAEEA